MDATSYNYIVKDAVAAGRVDTSRLASEISAAEITIALQNISTGEGTSGEEMLYVVFKDQLPDDQTLILDQIVHDHSGKPLDPLPQPVSIAESKVILQSQQKGLADMSGLNAYRKGYSHLVRAGTTVEFETAYTLKLKLQGLSLRFGGKVHEGTLELDGVPDAQNAGTGEIIQSVDSESTHHTRRYTFTVSSFTADSMTVDWSSDSDTSGQLTVRDGVGGYAVEDGLKVDFSSISDFSLNDKFVLTIDRGDYLELELVDVNGVLGQPGLVLAKFGDTIYPTRNWILESTYPDGKDLYNWLYIRVRYVSSRYATANTIIKFDHVMRLVTT